MNSVLFKPAPPIFFAAAINCILSLSAEAVFAGPLPLFIEQSLESGIYANHQQRAKHLRGLPDTFGPGVCVLDVNNDLWPDLLVLSGAGSTRHYGKPSWWQNAMGNRLYLNIPGGGFRDISAKAGLDAVVNGQGCTTGDLNNDGFADILITTTKKDLLYRNNGDSTFTRIENSPVTQDKRWTTGSVFVDINGDNRPDIYTGGFIQYEQDQKVFESSSGFKTGHSAAFLPNKYDAVSSRIYLNRGDFEFDNVTGEAGIRNRSGRTLGVGWQDLNQDGLTDLVELNGFGSDGKVWINQGKGRFHAEPTWQDLLDNSGTASLSFADFTDDARADAVFAGLTGEPLTVKSDLQDDITWDQAARAGQTLARTSWGQVIADFNNDGASDLFLANGLLYPHLDAPAAPQGQPDSLFLATEQGHKPVINIPELNLNKSSRAAVSADFNNDGALDLYVSANNSLGQLFINQKREGHWLQVIARDTDQHHRPDSMFVHFGEEKQRIFASQRSGHLSTGGQRFHFGLGAYDEPVGLTVHWQDGSRSHYKDIRPDSLYLVAPEQKPCRARGAVKSRLNACATDYGIRDAEPPEAGLMPELNRALAERKATIFGQSPTKPGSQKPDSMQHIAGEHDETIYWLEYALGNGIKLCYAAREAADLFDEEEAAVQKKYMLVPALVRALAQAPMKEKPCLIQALAHSERYRANAAVLTMLGSPDNKVREAAIIALGRIRQSTSMEQLKRVIRNGPPRASAYAVVSVERIKPGSGVSVFEQRIAELTAERRNNYRRALEQAREQWPVIGREK